MSANLHKIGDGYLCVIDKEKIFIIAINIADCMEQLEILAEGKSYSMETHSSVPVYHHP